ncbi:MAG: peptidoglycan DD-metalloendopeptidase family protein, partial [Longicatena sp.]
MKKLIKLMLSSLMILGVVVPVIAEDYSNKEEWNKKCARTDLTEEEKTACAGYVQYISDQSSSLAQELAAIEAERAEIAKNIQKYGEEIKGYNAKIATLQAEITTLNGQISIKEEEIKTKEIEIADNEAKVEALKQKMKDRMVASQSSMRLNQYIDIIMGAKDFNDLIRRTNGIGDIASYDEKTKNELKELIDLLNTAKAELETVKAELVTQKEEVQVKQNEIIVMKHRAEVAIQESQKQEAELEAKGNRIAGNIDQIKKDLAAMSETIDTIPSSSGFLRPVSGGRISASTWAYPSGGTHLGTDYAPGPGVAIRAAGNGVIIKSADGCPSTGGLGSSCGSQFGGSSGGGNQVYLLTKIGDTLYAVKYLHMQQGSPIAQNSKVSQGDTIGRVGSSGNSSGNHVH